MPTGPGAGIPPIPSKYLQFPVAAEDGSCLRHHQLHHGRTLTDYRRVSAARLTQALHTHTHTHCLISPKNPVFDGLSGVLQLGVVSETSNIAHVTPWVNFRRNQSVNLHNTVSEVQKKPRFLTVYRVSCSSALCWKLLILPMTLLGSIPS